MHHPPVSPASVLSINQFKPTKHENKRLWPFSSDEGLHLGPDSFICGCGREDRSEGGSYVGEGNREFTEEGTEGMVVWRGVAWRGVAWRGVAWRGVAWRGVAWRGGGGRDCFLGRGEEEVLFWERRGGGSEGVCSLERWRREEEQGIFRGRKFLGRDLWMESGCGRLVGGCGADMVGERGFFGEGREWEREDGERSPIRSPDRVSFRYLKEVLACSQAYKPS